MNIINLSLSKGMFPDILQIAKVIPVFKADHPDIFTNYRPISHPRTQGVQCGNEVGQFLSFQFFSVF